MVLHHQTLKIFFLFREKTHNIQNFQIISNETKKQKQKNSKACFRNGDI